MRAGVRNRLALTCLAFFVVLICSGMFLTAASAAEKKLFDESRAFDSEYGKRWRYLPPLVDTFATAVFAGLDLPITEVAQQMTVAAGAGQVRGPGQDQVSVPRFNGVAYARDEVCGCGFDVRGRMVDPTHCPAMNGVDDENLARMAAIMVIDRDALARPLACYRNGSSKCRDDGGLSFGGVSCCERADDGFAGALRDPEFYMLVPAPLQQRLRGLHPGAARAGSPELCGIAIDAEGGVFSLARRFDGLVARAWLYALKHYGTSPPATPDFLAKLSSTSPASPFELSRERMIRVRYHGGNELYDAALRAVPPSNEFRLMGAH